MFDAPIKRGQKIQPAYCDTSIPGNVLTVGLELPDSLSFEQWLEVGQTLRNVDRALPWMIGDWLNYGERRYGEKYSQALDQTGLQYQTLANYKWVSGCYEISNRLEILGFQHHQLVAKRDDRADWLDRASKHEWSVGRLKQELKEAKRREREELPEDFPARSDRYDLRVSDVSELDWVASESVDCILTDPPYPEEFLHVYSALSTTAARILRPGGSCAVMVGQSYLPEIIARLSENLTYHWCLSYLTPGGQAVQLWQRNVNTFWKPVLWFVKGKFDDDWLGDVAKSEPNDNDKRFHHWGQSESGMADLVRRFTRAGDTVCDPFVGGGTTAVVSIDLGRKFIGGDIAKEAVDATLSRLATLVDATDE